MAGIMESFKARQKGKRTATIYRGQTKGYTPDGFGILYSVEFLFSYDGPNEISKNGVKYTLSNKELDMTYVGITAQADPFARFEDHYEGAYSVYEKINSDPYKKSSNNKKAEDKLLYVALGSAMAANKNFVDKSFVGRQIIKIMDVVSLFDLGAMEKNYIKKYKSQANAGSAIENPFDLIKNNIQGLNTDAGGGGTLELQATTAQAREWIMAAYAYIAEKRPDVIGAREKSPSQITYTKQIGNMKKTYPFNSSNLSLVEKIFAVVNQFQSERRYKIPYISLSDIEDVTKMSGVKDESEITTKKNTEEGYDEIDFEALYGKTSIQFAINTMVMADDGTLLLNERTSRNVASKMLQQGMKSGKSEDVIKIIAEMKGKKSSKLKAVESKVSNDAVRKTAKELKQLISKPEFINIFKGSGKNDGSALGALVLIEKTLQDNGFSFKFSENFIDMFSFNQYKNSTEFFKLVSEAAIDILTKNLSNNLEKFEGQAGLLARLLRADGLLKEKILKAFKVPKNVGQKEVIIDFSSKPEKSVQKYGEAGQVPLTAVLSNNNRGGGQR